MPAAAVIPAPIAYIKFVAVKKLVVGLLGLFFAAVCLTAALPAGLLLLEGGRCPSLWWRTRIRDLYFEKIRVFKAGILAWIH